MALHNVAAALLLAVGVAHPAMPELAAQDAPAVFDALVGTWAGEGTLLGSPAAFRMTWGAEGGFATLRFRNALVQEDGTETPVLQAVAVYRTTGTPEGVWLDSRGMRIELAWRVRGRSLVVTWEAPDERGRTTYQLLGTDALEVVDEVAADGVWRVFARARYERDGPGSIMVR